MKNFLSLVSFLASTMAVQAAPQSGKEATSTRVALIRMQEAIKDTKDGKKAEATLKKEIEERQKKLQAEGQKIQAAMEELRKQGRIDDARASLAEFRKRYPDFKLPETLRNLAP